MCVHPSPPENLKILSLGRNYIKNLAGLVRWRTPPAHTHVLSVLHACSVCSAYGVWCGVVPGASGRVSGAAVVVLQHGGEAEGHYGPEEPEGEGRRH